MSLDFLFHQQVFKLCELNWLFVALFHADFVEQSFVIRRRVRRQEHESRRFDRKTLSLNLEVVVCGFKELAQFFDDL